jgi:2,3-bisphosphoglycerate-independent phosphoglycerate mutase
MVQPLDLMRQLHRSAGGKIVLLVMDGLGGMPIDPGGPTELEAARTPNMDRMAGEGCLGQITPVAPGISPGSGPAHLALFGIDPLVYQIGRGVLEATGVGLRIRPGDVAARGNFCTLDSQGLIQDRRAGRIASDQAAPLVERLAGIKVSGAEFEVRHVREYRFALVCRGSELHASIDDTDPQAVGAAPLPARPLAPEAERTAELFNAWIRQAQQMLAGERQANGLTLRGFSTDPALPKYEDIYGLRAVCLAQYPMYKGVSQLVGMEIHEFDGGDPQVQFAELETIWDEFDFFFLHVKPTDSRGEDGDFAGKAKVIETVDAALPKLLERGPDVLAITGDHSTPAALRSHSWHPVPLLLWAPGRVRPDAETAFGEGACSRGGLGSLRGVDVMPLLMAHADRLEKYGA